MNLREEYFNSFTKEYFEEVVNCLESQGYVIDSKDENGISFSSVQIEHMTPDMYDRLCGKFSIDSNIKVCKTGHYYPDEGAFSMLFNEEFYDYESAKKEMHDYINSM